MAEKPYIPAKLPGRQSLDLGQYQGAVARQLDELKQDHFSARLWNREPELWSRDAARQAGIRGSLGWLDVAGTMAANRELLALLLDEVLAAGFKRVVHMGMGGSSLAPLALAEVIPRGERGLPLTVLDSTDPAAILAVEDAAPLAETLFIVASKSGTTAEPRAFEEYFYQAVMRLKGESAGENFIAITDPDSPLAGSAEARGFRHIFLNFPDIGGRYSALSFFGLVPAALAGIDVAQLLQRAEAMVGACGAGVPAQDNPGLVLGAVLGTLGRHGRDKVTFMADQQFAPLALWLEQLLAESTGKQGKGLLPVAGEEPGAPSDYGSDRLFVYLRGEGDGASALDAVAGELMRAGQPLVTIGIEDPYDLGQEFFRWEMATATAGAVLGIDPFDQPNVQESKDNTNRLLAEVEKQGELPPESPLLVEEPLSLFHEGFVPPVSSIEAALDEFLGQARPGDYVALMAYLTENAATAQALAQMRLSLRSRLRLATTLGYGPRFLHSTGQFHKGGPDTGIFLQLTGDDARDALIPGKGYGFSTFRRAQAQGDLEALRRHGRRALRIHLGRDAGKGLARLENILRTATPEF
ncbi:MAG: bifunctional transaldolase/phosoglucose isomerase [Thermoleophilia bacterium]